MLKAFNFIGFIQLGVLIFAIVSFFIWDKRYRHKNISDIPPGFEKTNEITIDPVNGKKFRVYYNTSTGERFYHEENSHK